MTNKNQISRLTADIPKKYHVKLKSIALIQGKTIKEVLIELIENVNLKDLDDSISKDKKLDKIYKSLVKKYEPALKKLAKN